ncbi:MAG TPA: hypothetical protein VGO54_09475 [Bradyrhizobium sp.]|jgi:hypothetical protein|nr:hypothetical protein [Bradyrhizobium sp.]
MTKDDRTRANARFSKPNQAKVGKSDYDVATKAVLDNMAKLKALRLAREAAEPPRPAVVKKARGKSPAKAAEKAPALADWLAGQQNGGRRT